jgi:hypothetical protein
MYLQRDSKSQSLAQTAFRQGARDLFWRLVLKQRFQMKLGTVPKKGHYSGTQNVLVHAVLENRRLILWTTKALR